MTAVFGTDAARITPTPLAVNDLKFGALRIGGTRAHQDVENPRLLDPFHAFVIDRESVRRKLEFDCGLFTRL